MIFILIGLKGCGKTSLAKSVAPSLHLDYIDTDTLIEDEYNKAKETKYTFREIYELIGEDAFRDFEAEAFNRLEGTDNALISCGGSLPLNKKINLKKTFQEAKILYVYVQPDILKSRILQGGVPAFFDPEDIDGSFQKMWDERDLLYRSLCDDMFDNSPSGIESATGRFYNRLVSELMNKKIDFKH